MTKKEAINVEKNRELKILLGRYVDVPPYVYVNTNDPDLVPIRIKVPKCPDWKRIVGYGKKPEDQFFRREKYPPALDNLEKNIRRQISLEAESDRALRSINAKERAFRNRMYQALGKDKSRYSKEIAFIRNQWSHLLNGYWFFNNGMPTYIDGWHWFYLNYWNLEGEGLPSYWDRDRRWFLFMRHTYMDTTMPVLEDGDLVYESDGTVKMKDVGYRTCFGANVNKGRRVGDTSKSECINYCFLITHKEIHTGIQGDSGETGKKAFLEKMVAGFKSPALKFFFKAKAENYNPKNEIIFSSTEDNDSLGNTGDYASTAQRQFYDSRKLHFIHQDEIGKTFEEDVNERQRVLKRCCMLGSEIIGLMIGTTTVEDTSHQSIKKFLQLTGDSHAEKRSTTGQTVSGLYNLFIPAYDGYYGYIDKHGFGIIDTPTKEQIPYIKTPAKNENGIIMGAKEYLESQRRQLLLNGDIEGLASEKRLHPFQLRDCFTPPARNQFFNTAILESRYNQLTFEKQNKTRRGNFHWSGMTRMSEVVWNDDPENGKFVVSKLMPEKFHSRKIEMYGVFYPENGDKFVASADAFRLEKTDGSRMSNGGGAVRWKRDYGVDPDDKDIKNWQSASFVCSYNFRPPTVDEYVDDMLKMCVYYGALMYPEMNVDHVARLFKEWGYEGYLLYDVDPRTGQRKNNPGFHTAGSVGIKQKIFSYLGDDIQLHGHRWEHVELIEECLAIKGVDDMKDFDLFTAAGGCLLAEKSEYAKQLYHFTNSKYDVSDFWG